MCPTLQENGLFDVRALRGLEPEQIQGHVCAAEYKRGPVLGAMMALRVQHVALALAEGACYAPTWCRPDRNHWPATWVALSGQIVDWILEEASHDTPTSA